MSDPFTLAMLGLGGMFVMIALHVPIGVAMGIAGFVGVSLFVNTDAAMSLFAIESISAIANPGLGIIAVFLLMGSFANVAGLSADIFRLAYALIGHWRGGLAMATIAGCAGFGAVCGSSVATTATMGRIALPEMVERRYAPSFASGSIASGGTLGMLIPPSVIMVLYGILTEQFV
ncbi:MAG: TRAP transporter large permease subunit, partial [Alphaproteobacteria bacterium]|nr:TRAP transporter large permease subunit [Alphaproteobacteria bacterium]